MDKNEIKQMLLDEGYSEEEAEDLAEVVLTEDMEEDTDPQGLLETLQEGVDAVLTELDPENFSFVGNPAQPSEFVMMKNEDNERIYKTTGKIFTKEDDWNIVYAPVMVPNTKDKDGDVIPSSVVKESAHKYMKRSQTDAVDQEHQQITGKGTVVESWTLKEEDNREFTTPKGETVEYPPGTWMAGVEPEPDVKEDIKNGEVEGFSIFASGEELRLGKSRSYSKDSNEVNQNMTEEDEKQDEEIENVGDALDWLQENAPDEVVNFITNELRQEEDEEPEEEEEEMQEEKEEEDESTEKDIGELGSKIESLQDQVSEISEQLPEPETEDEEEETETEEETEDKEEDAEEDDSEAKTKASNSEGVRLGMLKDSGSSDRSFKSILKDYKRGDKI